MGASKQRLEVYLLPWRCWRSRQPSHRPRCLSSFRVTPALEPSRMAQRGLLLLPSTTLTSCLDSLSPQRRLAAAFLLLLVAPRPERSSGVHLAPSPSLSRQKNVPGRLLQVRQDLLDCRVTRQLEAKTHKAGPGAGARFRKVWATELQVFYDALTKNDCTSSSRPLLLLHTPIDDTAYIRLQEWLYRSRILHP